MKYEIIPQDKKAGIKDCVSADNALPVMLSCPNLPTQWIVCDGEKFWMFHPSANGWEKRREFKGHTQTLRVVNWMWCCAAATLLPFKIRRLRDGEDGLMWQEYCTRQQQ